MKILVTLFLLFNYSEAFTFGDSKRQNFQQNPKPCIVPTGKASFCVPLKECPYVQDLVKGLNRPLVPNVATLIKDSFFCPREDNEPISICCPFEGIEPQPEIEPPIPDRSGCSTQTGANASCTAYNKCAPFIQLIVNLKRPVPRTLPKLMQGSWLCGTENSGGFLLPKICCPNDAIQDDPVQPTTTTESTTTTTSSPPLEPREFADHPNRGLLADLKTCGKSVPIDGKIINGIEADIGEFPWLANLGYTLGSRPNVDWKCGGALIGPQHVLTAAHCVTQLPGSFKLAKVRLGEHRISTDPDCLGTLCNDPPQDFDVEKVIFHPDYNRPSVFRNDIAIIKLDAPARFSDYVKPICLPFDHEEDENYVETTFKNSTVYVAGWGATEERGRNPADALQKLRVPIFDADKCKEVYEKRGGILDPASQMCAGGEPGKDSCVGDSGSALMREEKPKFGGLFQYKMLGVVSFGPRLCGTKGVPGVYSKVRHYLPWILDNLE